MQIYSLILKLSVDKTVKQFVYVEASVFFCIHLHVYCNLSKVNLNIYYSLFNYDEILGYETEHIVLYNLINCKLLLINDNLCYENTLSFFK